MQWRDSAPRDAVAYVDRLFELHSAEVRERIAAETDPANPDHAVVYRIMEESRSELSDQLRDVLPRREHETLFPELWTPAGEQDGYMSHGASP
jgi:hypothetical protein